MGRILVVDDEFVVRQLVEKALSAAGYDVCLADSAEVALDLLSATRYEAAILDVNLPGISGIELHHRLWHLDRRLRIRERITSHFRPPMHPAWLRCSSSK